MDELINVTTDAPSIVPDDIEIIESIDTNLSRLPRIASPLVSSIKSSFSKIEKLLYSAPSFYNYVKSMIPDIQLQAVLTDEQKKKLAKGTLKLMTKKDGSLTAKLVNPKTGKIVQTIDLKEVKVNGDLGQAMASYATQMQMAQIAAQIQEVQGLIEEVRQGQEYDRLALAYSCQQKLLQAMAIDKPKLREIALLQVASDAENCRNQLMLIQKGDAKYLSEQPESFWEKLISPSSTKKVNSKIAEMKDNLSAVNLASLAAAMSYQALGENKAAQISLSYYAQFLKETYLSLPGFVERLDMIDPISENYWSNALPEIEKKINALPCCQENKLYLGDGKDE